MVVTHSDSRPLQALGIFSLLCLALVVLFSPGLFFSKVPAFRDAYHFYYPQAVWLDNCFQECDYFPAWNRYDGLGASAPGQVSTALYYPLRILWHIPGLSPAQRFSLFVVIHLLIAAIGIYCAVRCMNLDTGPASFAAVSYALCCPVFFQHNNLIYLTSAAWIGFAIAGLLLSKNHFAISAFLFISAVSLMVLGGDPHTASNAVLIAIAWQATRCFLPTRLAVVTRNLGWLSAVAIMIVLLTAVQWVPAYRWAQNSNRIHESSRELYAQELVSSSHRQVIERLERFELSDRKIYEFSLSPWNLPTLIWPTLGGHYLPQNSRVMSSIPSEGRMWIPSLYLGLVPLGMAAYGFTTCRAQRWFGWISLFALAAAMGNYSLGWLVREVATSTGFANVDYLPSDDRISVYGVLVKLVPNYESFRYPAKWIVWFAAFMSLLAANGLASYVDPDRKGLGITTKVSRWAIVSISIAILGVGLTLSLGPDSSWLQDHQPFDTWLGRAQAVEIGKSFAIAALVPLFCLGLMRVFAAPSSTKFAAIALIEMCFVCANWISFVDAPQATELTKPIVEHDSKIPGDELFIWSNIARANFEKHTDSTQSNLRRQTQLQRDFLLGKFAAIGNVRNLAAIQSVDVVDVEKLRAWLFAADTLAEQQPELDAVLANLGVQKRLFFSAESRELRWKDIAEAKAICSLENSNSSKIDWQWKASSKLSIQTETLLENLVIVRQYNDGGWELRINDRPSKIMPSSSPFIEFTVPAGASSVEIERRWFR